MLTIKDLCVSYEDKEILKSINIEVNDGEIVCMMGPNGAGKSSVCKSLMKYPGYKIAKGDIFYEKQKIDELSTSDIAKLGIYYISQSPIEIEGISNAEMLRTALMERGEKVDIFSFNKKCNEVLKKLGLPKDFLYRNVNEGMSGGERKKNELFGMWMLEPNFVILDEIDSGLDVDSLKLVASSLKEYHEKTNASILVITHHGELIDTLKPDVVYILKDGKVLKKGNYSLAKETLKNGFGTSDRANDVIKGTLNE